MKDFTKAGWWQHLVVSAVVGVLITLIPQLASAAPVDSNVQIILVGFANVVVSGLRQWAQDNV